MSSWESYLDEHQHPLNRGMHFLGAIIGPTITLIGIKRKSKKLLFSGIPSGLFIAWLGHAIFEKNRPKTYLQHPVRGHFYFYRMFFKSFRQILKNEKKPAIAK